MQPLMFVDIFDIQFEVSSSTEIRSHNGDFAFKSRCLYSEVSLLCTILMGNSASRIFVRQKLFTVEEIIDLTFTFEKDDDRSFLAMHFFNIFDNCSIKFNAMDFFELNYSLAIESID